MDAWRIIEVIQERTGRTIKEIIQVAVSEYAANTMANMDGNNGPILDREMAELEKFLNED